MTRVLYSIGRFEYLPDLALALQDRCGWEPTYWITQPELQEAVADRFPNAIRHDFTDANRGVNDPVPKSRLRPVDPHRLVADGLLLRQGLDIVARHVLGGAMTATQQGSFYLERLGYALSVVEALDLELFVLNATPHSVIDFAFYTAFRVTKRPVRILHLTGFRGFQVVLDHVQSDLLIGDHARAGRAELSVESQTVLHDLLDAGRAASPWYVEQQRDRDRSHARLYEIADSVLLEGNHEPGAVAFDRVVQRSPASVQEPRRSGWETALTGLSRLWRTGKENCTDGAGPVSGAAEDAFGRRFKPHHDGPMRRAMAYLPSGFRGPQITWRQYYTYRDWVLLTKRRWFHRYRELTEGFGIGMHTAGPFVFFPLNYQPERTTNPEGGVYSDQLLAQRTLVAALPKGWRILVKEHPSQFLWQTEGELGRWDGYYDEILGLGPVDLVPLSVSADRIIRDARAVVTVTGTAGWEAALAGLPTVTLANPWYAGEGVVLRAHDAQTLADAFKRIQAGWTADPELIKAHLAVIEAAGRRCYLNPSHAPLYPDLSPEENVRALTDLFAKTWQRQS